MDPQTLKRILFITAVAAERDAIGTVSADSIETVVVVGGIGRTNAAVAVTEALHGHGAFDAVLSVGVAGALPGGGLEIGQPVVASTCIYAEEGMIGPTGFIGIEGMGFSLGDFDGNAVPVDAVLLEKLGGHFAIGPIATVATCSGTDAAAAEVVRRTGAVAEAMEGAAVVHAARRAGVPAIELRVISNTTGDRPSQRWDLGAALKGLGGAVRKVVTIILE